MIADLASRFGVHSTIVHLWVHLGGGVKDGGGNPEIGTFYNHQRCMDTRSTSLGVYNLINLQ